MGGKHGGARRTNATEPSAKIRISEKKFKKRIKAIQNRALNKSRIAIGSEINRWNYMRKELTHCADTRVYSITPVVCTQPVAPSHISVMSRLFTDLNGLDRALNSKWRFSRSEQNTDFDPVSIEGLIYKMGWIFSPYYIY